MFYLTSRVITSAAVYLYPGYASYKTLSQRPASEEEIERWLMYWSVLGCIVSVEYLAEWLVSWIPFYYAAKTTFLLYMALPQTQGSSYLYINHLQPFFQRHEKEIDAALASLKSRAYAFVQERLRLLWEHVSATVTQQQVQAHDAPVTGVSDIDSGAQPTLGDPISGPIQMASTLWRTYGPGIVATGAAFLRQSQQAAATQSRTSWKALNTPPVPPSHGRTESSESVLQRRRQLEAELASLPPVGIELPANVPALPIPPASSALNTSRSSSDSSLRERSGPSGIFEEIGRSDVQGYDVDSGDTSSSERPEPVQRNSWFGWGSPSSKGVDERVKSD